MTSSQISQASALVHSDHSAPLLRLMYSSVNIQEFDTQSLEDLLSTCVINNQLSDITGVLMVNGLLNVQYIEGPDQAIRTLWDRICSDKRHHCIVQLYEEQGDLSRLFADWAMLKGQASRSEMLELIRQAYIRSDLQPRPAWSLAIAPLVILLDPQYSVAYAQTARI